MAATMSVTCHPPRAPHQFREECRRYAVGLFSIDSRGKPLVMFVLHCPASKKVRTNPTENLVSL